MFLPRLAPSKLLVPSLVIATVLASVELTQAKSIRSLGYSNLRTSDAIKMRRGGCAAFGHSCFGGHGKRAEPAEGEEAPAGLQPTADDVRTFLVGDGAQTQAEVFARDQSDDFNMLPSQYQPGEEYFRFSPLFRKWVFSARDRSEKLLGLFLGVMVSNIPSYLLSGKLSSGNFSGVSTFFTSWSVQLANSYRRGDLGTVNK